MIDFDSIESLYENFGNPGESLEEFAERWAYELENNRLIQFN